MSQRKKRALVVDDEEALRDIITEILYMINVEAITAETGIEAIEIASKMTELVDLMIIDLFMPNMTGEEAYKKLAEYFPDCPVLFISGFEVNNKQDNYGEKKKFLKKPFTLVQLQEAIEDLI